MTPKDQKIPMGGVATYRTFHFMKIFDLIDLVSYVRNPKMMVQAVQYQKRSFLDLSGFRKYTRGAYGGVATYRKPDRMNLSNLNK